MRTPGCWSYCDTGDCRRGVAELGVPEKLDGGLLNLLESRLLLYLYD